MRVFRVWWFVGCALGFLLLAVFWTRRVPVSGTTDPVVTSGGAAGISARAAPGGDRAGEARSTLLDSLHVPGTTIEDDMRVMAALFEQWQSNFPREGNPVGTNAEITAVLTGRNALHLALVPADHPAINADGELCDRWGTAFRFHQLSGSEMQIISAGPDRDFATTDDVVGP